jgi:hypothetical protein
MSPTASPPPVASHTRILHVATEAFITALTSFVLLVPLLFFFGIVPTYFSVLTVLEVAVFWTILVFCALELVDLVYTRNPCDCTPQPMDLKPTRRLKDAEAGWPREKSPV